MAVDSTTTNCLYHHPTIINICTLNGICISLDVQNSCRKCFYTGNKTLLDAIKHHVSVVYRKRDYKIVCLMYANYYVPKMLLSKIIFLCTLERLPWKNRCKRQKIECFNSHYKLLPTRLNVDLQMKFNLHIFGKIFVFFLDLIGFRKNLWGLVHSMISIHFQWKLICTELRNVCLSDIAPKGLDQVKISWNHLDPTAFWSPGREDIKTFLLWIRHKKVF